LHYAVSAAYLGNKNHALSMSRYAVNTCAVKNHCLGATDACGQKHFFYFTLLICIFAWLKFWCLTGYPHIPEQVV
jgi:hypothetical protein